MKNFKSLLQLKFDIWLIEQLQKAPYPGLTLEELRCRWTKVPSNRSRLSRDMLTNHRRDIKAFLGVIIDTPDRRHYRIMNPESLSLDTLANDLLKSIQNYVFLQEYKELGNLIQPEKIDTGSRYLRQIGIALEEKRKLYVVYQKFSDVEPYKATLHPYCLKADKGRWYILAYKEENNYNEPIQCFALDRMQHLEVKSDQFVPNPDIDVAEYFSDCFGIWRDFKKYPVQDITISCTKNVAHYLRTLPLHHSQKEDPYIDGQEGRILFHYHISPSPDFMGELLKWGDEVRIK